MFRRNESGNSFMMRLGAVVLALALIFTSANLDWASLTASADYGQNGCNVYSGTTIAQIYTARTVEALQTVSFSATTLIDEVTSDDEITATLTAIYRDPAGTPNSGTPVSLTTSQTTLDIVQYTSPVATFQFDISTLDITLAGGESISFLVHLQSTSGNQIAVLSNPSGSNGYSSASTGLSSDSTASLSFYMEDQLMDIGVEQGSLPNASATTNAKGNKLFLSVGQAFTLSATVGDSYYRTPEYELTSSTPDGVLSVDRRTGLITALSEGDAVVNVVGDGITSTPVAVKVVNIRADGSKPYPFTGAPVTPDLTFTGAPVTPDLIPTSLGFTPVVENPATKVGEHVVTISGGSERPEYHTSSTYVIAPADISGVTNGNFTIDTNSNLVTAGTVEFKGKTYYLDTDFSAVAVYRDRTVDISTTPYTITYKYDVDIYGKNNFTGTKVFNNYKYIASSNTMTIGQVYDAALSKTEIIWDGKVDGSGDPIIPDPAISYTNKLTGQRVSGTPLDVTVTWNYPKDASGKKTKGIATATITSDIYDSTEPIVLTYKIKRKLDNSDANVSVTLDKPSYVYEANGVYTPTPTLVVDGETVPINQYDVAYSNNNRVGNDATVTITAKNDEDSFYSGTVTKTFSIFANIHSADTKVSIGGAHSASDYGTAANGFLTSYTAKYTGSPIKLSGVDIEIIINGQVLDHSLYYIDPSDNGVSLPGDPRQCDNIEAGDGNGSVLIKTTEAYGSQSLRVYFNIAKMSVADVKIVTKDGGASAYSSARVYTGQEIKLHEQPGFGDKFDFVVTDDSNHELKPEDYEIEYENNKNVGEATLIVKGKGNYSGEKRTTFEIQPYNILGAKVTFDEIGPQSYKGNLAQVTPDVNMYFNGMLVANPSKENFKLEYNNNTDITTSVKKATVKITGVGNFTGTKTLQFEIVPKHITNASVEFSIGPWKASVQGGNTTLSIPTDPLYNKTVYQEYNGARQIPDLVIRDDRAKLTQGKDYNIRVINNTNANDGLGENPPTIIVTGINNYGSAADNTVRIVFEIKKRNITNRHITPKFDSNNSTATIVDTENKVRKGGVLVEGKDYTLQYLNADGSEWDGTSGGIINAVITGINNYEGVSITQVRKGKDVSNPAVVHIGTLNPLEGIVQDNLVASTTEKGTLRPAYIGQLYPKFFITDGNGKASTMFAILGSEETGEITVEYNKISGVDGFTAGDVVEAVIRGVGSDYFGERRIRYMVTPARFEHPTGAGATPYNYSDKYEIKINGKPVTFDSASEEYVCDFTYTGEKINASAQVSLKPTNAYPQYYPGFPESIDVPVTALDQLDLTSETSTATKSLRLSPQTANFTGVRMINYTVTKTSLGNGTAPGGGITISGVDPSYVYKGSAYGDGDIVPVVKYGNNELVAGEDYTITWGDAASGYDNTNVGNASFAGNKGGILKITGKGHFAGSFTKTFDITQKPITADMVTLSGFDFPDAKRFKYDGTSKVPTISINDGNRGLVNTTDFVVDWTGKDTVNPGLNKQIVINGVGNYTGTVDSLTYNIIAIISDDTKFKIAGMDTSSPYKYIMNNDGTVVGTVDTKKTLSGNDAGTVTLVATTVNGNTLTPTKGTEYTVSKSAGMVMPGKNGTITISGDASHGYEGTIEIKPIEIIGDISQASVDPISTQAYKGASTQIKPNPVVKYAGRVLSAGTDYELEYGTNNTIGATAGSITIKGKGQYTGSSQPVNFAIEYDLNEAEISGVNPTYAFTGTDITATGLTVKVNNTPLNGPEEANPDYKFTYTNNTNVGVATITIEKVDGRSFNGKTKTFNITPKDMNGFLSLSIKGSFYYTGSQIKPDELSEATVDVTYTVGGSTQTLKKGTDYDLFYSGNIAAGNATAVARLKGNYTGVTTGSFTINKRSFATDPPTIVPEVSNVTYTGSKPTPIYTLRDTLNNRILVEGQDYTAEIESDGSVASNKVQAQITFTGEGNYEGKIIGKFYILPLDLSATGTAQVSNATKEYDGNAVNLNNMKDTIVVKVKDGTGRDITLNSGTYNLSLEGDKLTGTDAINAGEYKLVITPRENSHNLTGRVESTFTITKKPLSATSGYTYSPEKDTIAGLLTPTPGSTDYDDFLSGTIPGITVIPSNISLQDNGRNHAPLVTAGLPSDATNPQVEVKYLGNDSAGPASLVFEATESGNYSGSIAIPFSVGQSIEGNGSTIAKADVTINPATMDTRGYFVYDGNMHLPEISSVTFGGKTLRPNQDYTVTNPENPVNVGKYKIKVTGSGKGYYGTVEVEYEIKPYEVAESDLIISHSSPLRGTGSNIYAYFTGSPITAPITVKDRRNQRDLVVGSDFKVEWDENTNVSQNTARYTVTFPAGCNYSGPDITRYFDIRPKTVEDGSISISFYPDEPYYEYTGLRVTPDLDVRYTSGGASVSLSPGADYLATYINNIYPGEASVHLDISGGNFNGEASKNFIIKGNLEEANVNIPKGNAGEEYDKSKITVAFAGRPLTEGRDYTLSVSYVGGSWKNATSAKVSVKSLSGGYYFGEYARTFTLERGATPDNPHNPPTVVDPNLEIRGLAASYAYTGQAIKKRPGTDFTIWNKSTNTQITTGIGAPEYFSTGDGLACIEEGTVTVTVPVTMSNGDIKYVQGEYRITGSGTGGGTGGGDGGGGGTVTPPAGSRTIARAYFGPGALTSYPYTGTQVRPTDIIVVDTAGTRLTKSVDYNIAYTNNINPGTATATITGVNSYAGSTPITLNYTITSGSGSGSTGGGGGGQTGGDDSLRIDGLSVRTAASTSNSLTLYWAANSRVSYYTLSYPGGSTRTLNGNSASVVVSGLSPSTRYVFTLTAHGTNGSTYTDSIPGTTLSGSGGSTGGSGGNTGGSGNTGGGSTGTPSAVTSLSASSSGGSATIRWSSTSDGTGFKIYRATSSTGTWSTIASVSGNAGTFTDNSSTLVRGRTYYYMIRPYIYSNGTYTYGSDSTIVSVVIQ